MKNVIKFIPFFAFVFILFLVTVSAAINVTNPISGSNISTAIELKCGFVNGSGITGDLHGPVSSASGWQANSTGTFVNLTTTNFFCTGVFCNASVSAANFPDARFQTVNCFLGNSTNATSRRFSNINVSDIDVYTDAPVCSFGTDIDIVEVQDAIGITTTQSSTKDALSSIVYNWTLWRSDFTKTQGTNSSTPTFLDGDFDQIDTFLLGLTVTDDWFNRDSCTNKSITVRGRDGSKDAATAQLFSLSSFVKDNTAVVIIASIVFLGGLAGFFILMISKMKKGGRRR